MIMRFACIIYFLLTSFGSITMADDSSKFPHTSFKELTSEERHVIEDKGTEAPFSGEYWDSSDVGEYNCKRCGAHLFDSDQKFAAQCGWPSFDEAIPGSVLKIPDSDGHRTEILCARCGAHLGHVFYGEHLTAKNTRYCVNSLSLDFVPITLNTSEKKAYYAGGCFWGVEYYLEKLNGVIAVSSGYMGGSLENPTYKDVSYKDTGHAETVEVIYDSNQISYEELTKHFFEIHDPTQLNRQGPDIGKQYRSAIFYNNAEEKATIEKLIKILKDRNIDVVTQVEPAKVFYQAELYHQNYYEKKGGTPYCHVYKKLF